MENIKKLEKVLDTLSNLYEDAAEVDSDEWVVPINV